MSDKNIAMLTLLTAAVGTIVVCVIAYKLNQTQDKIGNLTSNPVGAIKSLFGG